MDEYDTLLQQADALHTRIYRIRKACCVPTHIGLGTWGRTELTDKAKEQIAVLTKERNKLMGKAKRVQRKLQA